MKVIAEIAGRDSAAALLAFAAENELIEVIPTVAHTGTEYGDPAVLLDNLEFLKARLPGVRFAPLAELNDPELWSALGGRFIFKLINDFGIYSPCSTCHLYLHLLRLPLYFQTGAECIISGERDHHDGRLKPSQTPPLLDAFNRVLGSVGARLVHPIRQQYDGAAIGRLVGDGWGEGQRQMSCIFSGNHLDVEGSSLYDEAVMGRFIDGFLIPAGEALAARLVRGERDYAEAVIKAVWPNN